MNKLGIRDFNEFYNLSSKLGFFDFDILAHLPYTYDVTSDENEIALQKVKMIQNKLKLKTKNQRLSVFSTSGTIISNKLKTDLLRPGIGIYGINPSKEEINLSKSISIYAPIISFEKLAKNNTVSYEGTYTAKKDIDIAIVSFGYADGFNFALQKGFKVFYNGYFCDIIGKATMDNIIIDINHVAFEKRTKWVEIIGENNNIDDIVKNISGYHPHLFLTSIGKRVKKIII